MRIRTLSTILPRVNSGKKPKWNVRSGRYKKLTIKELRNLKSKGLDISYLKYSWFVTNKKNKSVSIHLDIINKKKKVLRIIKNK